VSSFSGGCVSSIVVVVDGSFGVKIAVTDLQRDGFRTYSG